MVFESCYFRTTACHWLMSCYIYNGFGIFFNHLCIFFYDSTVRMEVVVPRKERSNKHRGDSRVGLTIIYFYNLN